jgi:hypothetical protein
MHIVYSLAANSADNLARVQANFGKTDEVPLSDIWLATFILSFLILVGLVIAIIRHRRHQKKQKQGWSSITNAQVIWDIISRAISRNANFILEIYQSNHTVSYKGTLDSVEEDSLIVLSLQDTPSTEISFRGLPALIHINFRNAAKEPMDHFQFSTTISDSRFVKRQTWREAQLLIPIPKVITSAQRRNFLRLEPFAGFAFNMNIYDVPEGGSIQTLADLEMVGSGEVMDISIGGSQLKFPPTPGLKDTQRFVGIVELPTKDLDTVIVNPVLVILIQLISHETIQGLDDYGKDPHTMLRVRFLGRFLQDPLQGNWVYRGLNQEALEDLSHWMLAYQRYQIKRRKFMTSNRAPIPNMFPPTPPERPPLKFS